jgi:hypothetical protein
VHLRETRSTLGGFAADPAAPWAARTISPPSQCRHVKVVVDPTLRPPSYAPIQLVVGVDSYRSFHPVWLAHDELVTPAEPV